MPPIRPARLAGLLCLAAGLALAPLALPAPREAPPGDGPWVVRATFTERRQVQRLAAEIEPWEVHYDQGYVVLDVDRQDWQFLLQLGFEPEVDELLTEELRRPRTRLPGQVSGIPSYPCYRTVEETFASAQAIVAAHPSLATWIDIGDSWEKLTPGGAAGYDMLVLKLTNSAVPGPKPRLFASGSIHAREYTPAEVLMRFAESMVNGYGSDPDGTWILDHHELHLLLEANPDGRKHAEAGASWRKNTNGNYCGATSSSRGVDLNRNFPFQWNCCGGSSSSPCADTYHGPSAASDPETQAIRDYGRSIFPYYWTGGTPPTSGTVPTDAAGMYIDLHSYGELVLWPWGYSDTVGPAPNGPALQTLGRKFAYFNNHTPEQSNELYGADGATDDFHYGDRGVAAYTFELGTSFFQGCTSFTNSVLPGNLQALKYAARVVRAPYLLPSGPDALTLVASPGSVTPGAVVTVTATLDDTRYNNSNGSEPSQSIAAGQAYVDVPPWSPGATATAMSPNDGAFNSPTEAVTVALPTSGWTTGRHTVFVRGQDASGNWGPVSALFVDVAVPVELQQLTIE